ncbi:hypothetical protein JJQ72_06805 [Paenibacillus sp. F411]|uniref:hypothetical protein n=1 Tax=Paenibacillus sp. F411 TaxID=2820239 RepID=UPI001AAF65F5|nr:hypothetical protein [Paenibacillus sp. F411]MBO2943685.1 hypothetical protein [Paenibacillus sp. F411]
MRAVVRHCSTDRDYAGLTRFYINHTRDFDRSYSLQDGLFHILTTLNDFQFITYHNAQEHLIGFVQYRTEEEKGTVFVDAAILEEKYRSTSVFYYGLQDLIKYILENNKEVKSMYFFAAADNPYVNRLYRKFARLVDVTHRRGRPENVYAADLQGLLHDLRVY